VDDGNGENEPAEALDLMRQDAREDAIVMLCSQCLLSLAGTDGSFDARQSCCFAVCLVVISCRLPINVFAPAVFPFLFETARIDI
jgi:hypothetical protein